MIELTQDQIDDVVTEELKNLLLQLWTDGLKDNYLYDATSTVLSYYMNTEEYETYMQSLEGK